MSKQYLTDAQTINLSRLINIIALIGLLGVLAGSLNLQLRVGEQPCPLCLIQRSGMIGLAVGSGHELAVGNAPSPLRTEHACRSCRWCSKYAPDLAAYF